jgi:hypothetical protein
VIGTGAPSTTTATTHVGSTGTQQLDFAACMRAHGVPNFPDPESSGQFNKSTLARLAASDSQFPSASHSCQHLLPQPSVAQQRQQTVQALEFSECMRRHGVTKFPDPASDGRIPDPATFGIDQGSPQFQQANQACGNYRPPYMPSNAAYNADARANGS